MFQPGKRLGDEEDAPSGNKPKSKVVVAIGFDPKKRLGDDEPDGDEEKPSSDADKIMDDAALSLCKAIARMCNVSSMSVEKAAPVVRQCLESFCAAADSKPHDEGEHTNEGAEGGEEN